MWVKSSVSHNIVTWCSSTCYAVSLYRSLYHPDRYVTFKMLILFFLNDLYMESFFFFLDILIAPVVKIWWCGEIKDLFLTMKRCERDDHWEDLHPINLPEALQWRHLSYHRKSPMARKAKPYINHTIPQAKVWEIIIHSITNQLAFFP